MITYPINARSCLLLSKSYIDKNLKLFCFEISLLFRIRLLKRLLLLLLLFSLFVLSILMFLIALFLILFLFLIFFNPANIFFIKLHKFMKAIWPQIPFLLKILISLKHFLIIAPIFPLILMKIIRFMTTLISFAIIPSILNQYLISPK